MFHVGDHIDGNSKQLGDEGKFGCNISHLSRYSDVAEKSMEKFVSIMSTFRCTSGSRASGLRAPLRDVNNTVQIRYGSYPRNFQILCLPESTNAR